MCVKNNLNVVKNILIEVVATDYRASYYTTDGRAAWLLPAAATCGIWRFHVAVLSYIVK